MKPIPIYALYGEDRYPDEADWLHWETITSRSRLYGFRIAPHRHEQFFQILFLRSGNARAAIDGETFDLGPVSLVTVPSLCVHGYDFSEDVDGVVLTFFERDIRNLLTEIPEMGYLFLRASVISAGEDEARELHNAIHGLVLECGSRVPGRSAAIRARITLLLLTILRLGMTTASHDEGRAGRSAQLARAFHALVERRYRETRSVPCYAGELGITPTHLNRVCRQVLGQSALSVIERRIVLEAKRYLQFSTLSVKEIGILLGYPDPAYFSRFFRRAAGYPPSRLRAAVTAK
ncbi:helix-turn-helix domain-containing protein [Chelativorans sp. AA-79]|uniref:helix-turn-helix domain-containing protein n=1 Tax=Chelativorans sp. AA-79 TaxID=3028735 RepID=UPI0023F72B0A|nr:helix-turn-helix domain-containing protein [Chelativorans sp. AA-79]WEX10495.1 helix-turn-helix domain-containing protein [Chelativorans sp. AA-79]